MTTRRRVLVTATGGRSVGCGILYALSGGWGRQPNERWDLVAADADPYAFGLYKVPGRCLLPAASSPDYLPRLREVVAEQGIEAVIPGSEPEAILLSQERERFAPVQVITNHHSLMGLMSDKRLLAARLMELGVDTPATAPAAEWEAFTQRHGFPVILKPAWGTGGSRGVRILQDPAKARASIAELGDESSRFLVQEYIGSGNGEFTVGILTDKHGALIDSIVLQRQLTGLSLLERVGHQGREYAISTGYSQGFIIDHPAVRAACESLALRLGSRGPLNIQLRMVGDRPVVFEVHPRFSGTTPIRADAGFNEPDVLLRNWLDDEPFGRLPYRTNLLAIRAFEHVLVPLKEYTDLGGKMPGVG